MIGRKSQWGWGGDLKIAVDCHISHITKATVDDVGYVLTRGVVCVRLSHILPLNPQPRQLQKSISKYVDNSS